jgi:hypothetical protein
VMADITANPHIFDKTTIEELAPTEEGDAEWVSK